MPVVHGGLSYGAPRALLILEAQAKLANFLYDFVKSMIASPDSSIPQAITERSSSNTPYFIGVKHNEGLPKGQFGITYYNVGTHGPGNISFRVNH